MRSWMCVTALCAALLPLSCHAPARPIASTSDLAAQNAEQAGGLPPLLKDTAQIALQAGGRSFHLLSEGAGAAGDNVAAFVYVPEGRCALFFARSGSSVIDLDLHIFGDDGAQYGSDEAPDDLPTLLVCPGQNVRLYASARIAQGEGYVAIGYVDVSESNAEAVAHAVGARSGRTPKEDAAESWPGLELVLAERRRGLGGQWSDVRRVALPVDSRVSTRVDVSVADKQCLDLLVLSDTPQLDLELLVRDSQGRIVLRKTADADQMSALLCQTSGAQTLTAELRPRAGQGIALLSVSGSQDLAGLYQASRDEAILMGERPTLADASEGEQLASLVLQRGEVYRRSLKQRGCSRLLVHHKTQAAAARLRAWDETGKLLAEASLLAPHQLWLCFDGNVELEVAAEAAIASAEITRHNLTARDPQHLQLLSKEPLAAARLLATLADQSGASFSLEQLRQLSLLELRAGQRVELTPALAAGPCGATVASSADGSARMSLYSRLSDGGTKRRVTEGRGLVQVEQCPGIAPAEHMQLSSSSATSVLLGLWGPP